MPAVGKLFHHATGKCGMEHTIRKACLHDRGVTIPWGSWLWLAPKDARKQNVPILKLTQLATLAIRNGQRLAGVTVTGSSPSGTGD